MLAYDVVFNREVLGDTGRFFATRPRVALLAEAEENRSRTIARRSCRPDQGGDFYRWDDVAGKYRDLAVRLAGA